MNHPTNSHGTDGTVRAILLELAKQQEDLAAQEAAATPYWAACPTSALGRRAAAAVLRQHADHVGTAVYPSAS